MDKVKILMDKYGLSIGVAQYVCSFLSVEKIGTKLSNSKKDNFKEIELIEKSCEYKPDPTSQPIEYFFGSTGLVRMKTTGITKIKFWLDSGEQVTIDSENVINDIAFLFHNKKYSKTPYLINGTQLKPGNQPKKGYQFILANELMKIAPTGTAYSKRVWIGRVFSEFLPEYQLCNDSPFHLQKKIADILRDKNQ